MKPSSIDFYFDFLSPYSYVAWTRIRNDSSLNINFFPISLPGLFSHHETKGPGQIEPKRNYLMKDLLRFTTINNIPFTTPPSLPFNSLYALRLALPSISKNEQSKVIDIFFRAAWEKGLDIGNSDIVELLLRENGLAAEEMLAAISSKEIRIELKKNGEKAIARGVFGVPTFFYKDEMFWGNDSLVYLKMAIENKDPLDKNKYEQFIQNYPMNK